MQGKAEAKAISKIFAILEKLPDKESRQRVVSFVFGSAYDESKPSSPRGIVAAPVTIPPPVATSES